MYINKTLIVVNILMILGLLLSACGGSISGGIQLPAAPSSDSSNGDQAAYNNILIYVLIGAVVLGALIALLKK